MTPAPKIVERHACEALTQKAGPLRGSSRQASAGHVFGFATEGCCGKSVSEDHTAHLTRPAGSELLIQSLYQKSHIIPSPSFQLVVTRAEMQGTPHGQEPSTPRSGASLTEAR